MSDSLGSCRIVGVDIGGSHITAGCMDVQNSRIEPGTRMRRRIRSLGTADEIVDGWSEVIAEVCGKASNSDLRLGIAMPGPFDYESGVSFIKNMNKYDSLYGMNIKDLLAQKLGMSGDNILFRNDAEAYLHGEVVFGAAKGFRRAIGVTLGTGLGSACSIESITKDVNRAVDPFLDGIAEDFISTRWFVKKYFELSGQKVEDVYELSQLAVHPWVKDIFDQFGQNLAVFLARFARNENPEVIVIGGNIAKSWHLFGPSIQDYFDTNQIDIPLKIALLGEDAALFGAVHQFIDPPISGREERVLN